MRPTLRDRIDDLLWRLFVSSYTSWRQDRAYRKFRTATIPKRQGET